MDWINRARILRPNSWIEYAEWHFGTLAGGADFGLWLGTMRQYPQSWIVVGHDAPPQRAADESDEEGWPDGHQRTG